MIRTLVKDAVKTILLIRVEHPEEETLETWEKGINKCKFTQEEKDWALEVVRKAYALK